MASCWVEDSPETPRGELSKFQVCLPKAAERQLLVERLLDVPRAAAVLRDPIVQVAGGGD